MSQNSFEKHWGFTRDEVMDGDVGFSYQDWFISLRKAIEDRLHQDYVGAKPKEKAKFTCLVYMACATYAEKSTPRDISEKTYPEFNAALLGLQEEFKYHGEMLGALHKRAFRESLADGKNNVEAVNFQKDAFKKVFEHSFITEAAKDAKINIEWD